MKGDWAMIQRIIACVFLMGLVGLEVCQWHIGLPFIMVWTLLMGLLGLLWVMVLSIFGDDLPAHDNRQGQSPSSELHDGEEPLGRSPLRSKADLGVFAVRRES